ICLGAGYCRRQARKLKPFKMFRCEEGRFSVLFPGNRKKGSGPLSTPQGDIDFVMYRVKAYGLTIAVSFGDYPEQAMESYSAEEILSGFTEPWVKDTKDRVVWKNLEDFYGYPARELRVNTVRKNKRLVMRVRFILIENRIYLLSVACRSEDALDKYAPKFFESFRVDGVGEDVIDY
ncbi:MAG: hypothetical protein ACYSTJ_04255, partial [Planctomycetota bacterium]